MLFLPYKVSYSNYKISGEYIKHVWLFPTYDTVNMDTELQIPN